MPRFGIRRAKAKDREDTDRAAQSIYRQMAVRRRALLDAVWRRWDADMDGHVVLFSEEEYMAARAAARAGRLPQDSPMLV